VELEVWQQQTRAQQQQQQQQGQHFSTLKQGMGGDGQQDKDQGGSSHLTCTAPKSSDEQCAVGLQDAAAGYVCLGLVALCAF
jgi:hypothetical protein